MVFILILNLFCNPLILHPIYEVGNKGPNYINYMSALFAFLAANLQYQFKKNEFNSIINEKIYEKYRFNLCEVLYKLM